MHEVRQSVLQCARFCQYAYIGRITGKHAFAWQYVAIRQDNASALLCWSDQEVMLAVAGSDESEDWTSNLWAFKHQIRQFGISIHKGIYFFTQQLWHARFQFFGKERSLPDVIGQLLNKPRKLIVTGHSLGGAAACELGRLCQLRFAIEPNVVTFGQPRLYDSISAPHYSVQTIRVANAGDPVPRMPSAFRFNHVGRSWYLRRDGTIVTRDPLWLVKSSWVLAIRFIWNAIGKILGLKRQRYVTEHFLEEYISRLKKGMNDAKQEK